MPVVKLNDLFSLVHDNATDQNDRDAKYGMIRYILKFRAYMGIDNDVAELHPTRRGRIITYNPSVLDIETQIEEIYNIYCCAFRAHSERHEIAINQADVEADDADDVEDDADADDQVEDDADLQVEDDADLQVEDDHYTHHDQEEVIDVKEKQLDQNEQVTTIQTTEPAQHTTIVLKVSFDPIIYTLMFGNCLMTIFMTFRVWSVCK
jgi:hypothetical protein